MSANEATTTNQSNEVADKGKGKANESVNDTKDVNMDESEVSSDEEEHNAETVEDEGLEEMDSNNIIGSRTRGKQIDFAKAAQEVPEDEYNESDDEDFEEPADEDEDRMED